MSSFGSAFQDGVDDRVRVRFYSKDEKFEEPRFFEDYSVRVSVLQQPAAFAVRLSARDGAAKVLKAVPPNTKFQLFTGLMPQFTGYTDAQTANGSGGSTSVSLKGRDVLAKLFDNDVDAEMSMTNVTYADIVRKAMDKGGLEAATLAFDGAKNKQIRVGFRVRETAVEVVSSDVLRTDGGAVTKHVVRAKLDESWLDFVRRHIAKAGLFVWSDYAGNLVLSSPNPRQSPLFKWVRRRDSAGEYLDSGTARVNVFDANYVNDTTRRFSKVTIYARGAGRNSGRGHLHGSYVDEEMVAFGIRRERTYRDVNVTSVKEAEAYARRKVAEINRASCFVSYTFAGHSAPAIYGGRAVITPDTIAHITDDEFGIDEPMYIETVEYKSPPTTTTVTLMRIKDLIFGADS